MLTVRRAELSDLETLFQMKCDPDDVKWSGFASSPDPLTFRTWFANALNDPDRLLFMVLLDGGVAGYCNWRRTGNWFEPSSGTLPQFRNCGVARDGRTECIKLIRQHCSTAKFECWIALENVSAQKSALKNGFCHDGKVKGVEFLYPTPRLEQMMHYVMGQ